MSQSKLAITVTHIEVNSRKVDKARLQLLSPSESPLSSTPIFSVSSVSRHPLLLLCPDNEDLNILVLQNQQSDRIGQAEFDSTIRACVGRGPFQMVLVCVGIVQIKLMIVVQEAGQAILLQTRNRQCLQNKQILLQIVRLHSQLDFTSKQNVRLLSQLQSSNQTINQLLTMNSSLSNQLALHKRITTRIARQLNLSQQATLTTQQQSKIANVMANYRNRARKSQHLEKQVLLFKKYQAELWRLSEHNHRDAEINRLNEKISFLDNQLVQVNEAYNQLEQQFDKYEQQADSYYNQLMRKTQKLQDANQQMSVSIEKANRIADYPARLNKLAATAMNTITVLTSQLAKCNQIQSLQNLLTTTLNKLLHGLQQNQFYLDAEISLQLPLLREDHSRVVTTTVRQVEYSPIHLNN